MCRKEMNEVERFHHPFKPYKIQYEFMENLYSTISQGGIGIFESPTGTVGSKGLESV